MPYTPIILINTDLLKQKQYESGLTNWQTAKAVGVSSATYDRWKAEGRIPRKKYPQLAQTLGLPPEDDLPVERDQDTEDKLELVLRELRALRSDVTLIINSLEGTNG